MPVFDLGLSDDELFVQETFRTFFGKESTPEVVRAAEPLGHSPSLWTSLGEIGAPGMGVAESLGGGGAALGQLVVAMTEAGVALVPAPIVEHLVATRAMGSLVPADVVDGSVVAAFAPRPAEHGGWTLVPGGAVAGVVVGLVGEELVAVRSEAPGVAPTNVACAPVAPRSTDGERTVLGDRADWLRARAEWETLTGAVMVGLAERALTMGVEYAMTRQQFGVPIGSFQAVQHGLAAIVPKLDGARLLVHKAAWALEEGKEGEIDVVHNDISDATTLAGMAFVNASEAAAFATDRSLHFHGGYGYSKEYDIQLYYRRARGWPLVAGSLSQRVRELADALFPKEVAK